MENQTNSLIIDTGEIRLPVNGDPARVITFNPNDVAFVEGFYHLADSLDSLGDELIKELDVIWDKKETRSISYKDEKGKEVTAEVPVNFQERCDFLRSMHKKLCESIDSVFGKGTSYKLFGDFVPIPEDNPKFPNIYKQFFDGVTPYIKSTRESKMAKYEPTQESKDRARAKAKKVAK